MSDNKTEYMRQFRAARSAKGLCIRCGKYPPRPGFKTCGCDLTYQQERTKKLSKQGECRRCRDPIKDGMQLCVTCREYDYARKTERTKLHLKKGLCGQCGNGKPKKGQKWCEICCEKVRQRSIKVRLEVFAHYGAVCECCGESEPDFLSIDHINGGGTAHRKSIGIGRSIYMWLKVQDYPAGYRVLCFNCNCGRKPDGKCPHKRTAKE